MPAPDPNAHTARWNWLPLKEHLAAADARSVKRDAAAGFNVALLAIPQGMAFAMIAGLPHHASGILCSGVAAITGALFSSARFTILGPTNATALMLFAAIAATGAAAAPGPLVVLMAGIILAAALLLGNLTSSIPRPALAALVICVTPALFNLRHLRICWRATRSDAITLSVTLLATLLLPLHTALFLGVAASIALYLRKASRPVLVEYEFNDEGTLRERSAGTNRQHPRISIVHVEGELFFGAAEVFRTQIQRTARDENLRVIILRLRNARHLDATSVMAIEDLVRFLHSDGRHLLVSGLTKDVYRVLFRSGTVETIGRDNIFMGSTRNPNLSTRNALKRAQQLLGTSEAEIQILFQPDSP